MTQQRWAIRERFAGTWQFVDRFQPCGRRIPYQVRWTCNLGEARTWASKASARRTMERWHIRLGEVVRVSQVLAVVEVAR